MEKLHTFVLGLAAGLVALGAAAVGCRAGNDDPLYGYVAEPSTLQVDAPPSATPPQEQPPPLPAQEQPFKAPAPTEALPQGLAPVPSVPLSVGEEPSATEVLTSGPVNEAFAEPVDVQPQPGLLVQAQPPADIDEVPPQEAPEGIDIVWVPGYWAWEPDRAGYVWVSGCWRAAPPATHWVPGYWAEVSGGWQWVSGYWQLDSVQTNIYLPEAPPAEDLEAPGPPPAEDQVWVPPCPYWLQGRYVVRQGYWLTLRDGWVWVPSHYVWTPRGYIFIAGHWDRSLDQRGMLFAPVYIPPAIYVQPAYSFSPTIVVDLGLLTSDLFAFPRYCHYFFGDYYGDTYLNTGIYPWCDSITIHKWYDPVFVYDRWRYRRTNPRWAQQQRTHYDRRRADKALRPPRTYREMESRLSALPQSEQRGHRLAGPITSAFATQTPRKLRQLNTAQARQKSVTQAQNVHRARQERQRRESSSGGAGPRAVPPAPTPRGRGLPPVTGRGGTPPNQVMPAPKQRGEIIRPRGARTPSGREARPPREGRQPVPPPQAAPKTGQPPREQQQAAHEGRQNRLSNEQLQMQEWAREQQEAANRQKQQREPSAEQTRQQQWARTQQEAANRQREQRQAAQQARQRERVKSQQQQDLQRQQRQQQPQERRMQGQERPQSQHSGGGGHGSGRRGG